MAKQKIGFVSLGCPKALVDSERIVTQLRVEGYDIVPSYRDANLVVVNTCGFIDDAVAESLDAIGEALAENGKVIVTGCLGAKGDIVKQTHPAVLAITGPHATEEVLEHVHTHLPPPEYNPYTNIIPPGGIKLTPRHYAYLKISEGCNHRCTFCIIPSLRGDLVSRPIGDILAEAENLVDAGVRELLVVSQDTSAYGVDIKYRTGFWQGKPLKSNLTTLAKSLGELGVWVRMHYVYPYPHVDELVPLMAEGTVLPYLDIPLQHAAPSVLKAMRRPANVDNMLQRIASWRRDVPNLVIRSTFIVGFPGETEHDFQQLLDFLSEAQLDRVGAFAYSPVEGAAANALPGAIADEVKKERLMRFMAHQAEISAQRLASRIGNVETVVVDEVAEDGWIARSYSDAPEIDGSVYVEPIGEVEPGDFVDVIITGSDEHDLYAEPLTEENRQFVTLQ